MYLKLWGALVTEKKPKEHDATTNADPQKLDPSDPVVRLMQENSRYRNTLDELRVILRFEFPKDTEGLGLQHVLRLVLKEREAAAATALQLKNSVAKIKSMAQKDMTTDILDECEKILKNKL